jgi:hypothetical protein
MPNSRRATCAIRRLRGDARNRTHETRGEPRRPEPAMRNVCPDVERDRDVLRRIRVAFRRAAGNPVCGLISKSEKIRTRGQNSA